MQFSDFFPRFSSFCINHVRHKHYVIVIFFTENNVKKEPMIKVNDVEIDDSEDDTLKDDEVNDVNSATTDVSHTTELLVDDANIVISSPLPTPCRDDDKSKINGLKKLVIFFFREIIFTKFLVKK